MIKSELDFFTDFFQLVGKISSRNVWLLRLNRALFIWAASVACVLPARTKGVFQTTTQLRTALSCLVPLFTATSGMAFQYLTEEAGEGPFMVSSSDRTKGNEYKLEEDR